MPLPYAGDPDIAAPDDCGESYQHVNRAIWTCDDLVDLMDAQHWHDVDVQDREYHDVGRMPQGIVGMLIVEPPANPDEQDGHTVVAQRGEVGQTHWRFAGNASKAANEYILVVRHPLADAPRTIATRFVGADVHVEPDAALVVGPPSTLRLVRPHVFNRGDQIEIYFGTAGIETIVQFLVLIWGYRVGT